MARLTLADLSPAVREQVMAQYGMAPMLAARPKKVKPKQIGAALSPYADLLGDALDARFPGRMLREYQPVKDRKFRIDFAFPLEKVAVEFDGYRYHGFSKKGFKQGLERQNILVAHGWRVLRYTLTDVRDRLDSVVEEIGQALGQVGGI
ncbi:MAG: endonuclease domain-containing protein [Acidithiobacillus sp.]